MTQLNADIFGCSASIKHLKNNINNPILKTMFHTISMIGLGYIGLPTATLFASRKMKVIGVDVNQHA